MFGFQISDEVLIGTVTFLLPILFSVIKRGVTPYLTRRSARKTAQKAIEAKSRRDVVDSLVLACDKADKEQLRVLIPKLLEIGERPRLSCLLDYIEKEDSFRLKAVKKFLLEECKKNKETRETVALSVATSPAIATELAKMMTKLA